MKKGFSLIEVLLAVVIAGIAMVAVSKYFNLYSVAENTKTKFLDSKNTKHNIFIIRNAIKEGRFVDGENVIANTMISSNKIAIQTSFFSNDYNNPNIYVLECSPNNNGNGTLKSYLLEDSDTVNTSTQVVTNRVKTCSFVGYDKNGVQTTDTRTAIRLVVEFSYYPENTNSLKTEKIVTKMMRG